MKQVTVDRTFEDGVEDINREAYGVADHILAVMHELDVLSEHATEVTGGYAPQNALDDALMRDAYDVLNAANLTRGVVGSAYDVITTLAAY